MTELEDGGICITEDDECWMKLHEAWTALSLDLPTYKDRNVEFCKKYNVTMTQSSDPLPAWRQYRELSSVTFKNKEAYLSFKLMWG